MGVSSLASFYSAVKRERSAQLVRLMALLALALAMSKSRRQGLPYMIGE